MTTAAANAAGPATAAPAEPQKKKSKPRRRTAIVTQQQQAIVHLDFNTDQGFALAQRRALALAGSSAVPELFRGGPGSEGYCNCLLALELAVRLDFPPLLVIQNLTLVDGRPSWQGKFYVALVQRPGSKYRDPAWEVQDEPRPGEEPRDTFAKRFYATRISDGKVCYGEWISVHMAKEKGWWTKKDTRGKEWSHWPSMTGQMLSYRSSSFWANAWDPGATLGLRSADEERDAADPHVLARDVTPQQSAPPPAAAARQAAPPRAAERTVEVPRAAPTPFDEPEDVLSPGIDPPSMAPPGVDDPLVKVRARLDAKDWLGAMKAIADLPRGSQARTAAENLYSKARKATP